MRRFIITVLTVLTFTTAGIAGASATREPMPRGAVGTSLYRCAPLRAETTGAWSRCLTRTYLLMTGYRLKRSEWSANRSAGTWKVTRSQESTPIMLPECRTEYSSGPCYWDASRNGNGRGTSFVVADNGAVYGYATTER